MTLKIHRLLIGLCLVALGITTTTFSQPAEKYYLRLTPLKSPKDSLALEIELRFWQEFREQAEKSETVKIVSGWDEIVDLLEYAEEIARTPAIFDTSKIEKPAMIQANVHVAGTIRILRREVEVDIQIKKIRTGEQIATGQARIAISTDPFPVSYTPALRQLIQKLMAPLDPKIKKQKQWLGEPFDPEKINILVADFINFEGNVDAPGKQWAWKTFNELDQFMKADPGLREVVEVKRLYSDSTGIAIREESHAKEVGEAMNADMIIWGQNLCAGDSICYYAKAFITHEVRVASTIQGGVMHQTKLLRADLPMLIGAKANVLVKFIIGWTYLKDYQHQQFQKALSYLQQALDETKADDRWDILGWIGNSAHHAGRYEQALTWYTQLKQHQIETGNRTDLAKTYNNIGAVYDSKYEWDRALEFYKKSEAIKLEIGDRTGLASTYNNIEMIYSNKGEWDKALEFYKRSEALRVGAEDRTGLAPTYNNMGLIYFNKNEWDDALESYRKAEAISLESGDRVTLTTIYNNIATLYGEKEDFVQAIQFGQRSLQITLQIGDLINENLAHFGLAKTLLVQKRYQEAVTHLERCVEIDRQLKHPRLEKDLQELMMMQLRAYSASGTRYETFDKYWANLNDRQKGNLFHQINDWSRATGYYLCYHRKSRGSLTLVEQAEVQNLIGICYTKQSKGDSALPYLQTALQAFQKINDQRMVGTIYNNIGSTHKMRQAWPEALEWLRKSAAHNRAVAGDSASVLGFTYYHLAEVFLHTHQPDSARYYVEKSLLLRQALGEAENVKQTRELRERIPPPAPKSSKK